MPHVYSQRREDDTIMVIGHGEVQGCRDLIASHARSWISSKKGRTVKPSGSLEMHFLFSDKKVAAHMWIEMLPPPHGENPFKAATGPVPGLEA